MFNLRTRRRGTVTSRLLVMLALLALAGTACADLDGALPVDVPEAGDEEPAEGEGEGSGAEDDDASADGEDTTDDGADDATDGDGDDAAGDGDDAAGDDGDDAGAEVPAAAGDDAGGGVDPITADDVGEVCGDPDASAATAEELAPLVNLTPETFETLACAAVS